MKLQVNTEEKTIVLEESIELDKLFETVKKLFPENEWKKYKLEPKIIQSWNNPIVIDRFPTYPLPWWNQFFYVTPPSSPTITYDSGDNTTYKNGVYNVNLQ